MRAWTRLLLSHRCAAEGRVHGGERDRTSAEVRAQEGQRGVLTVGEIGRLLETAEGLMRTRASGGQPAAQGAAAEERGGDAGRNQGAVLLHRLPALRGRREVWMCFQRVPGCACLV